MNERMENVEFREKSRFLFILYITFYIESIWQSHLNNLVISELKDAIKFFVVPVFPR